MRYVLPFCVALLAMGCTAAVVTEEEPGPDPGQVLGEIEAANRALAQAFNDHDAEAMAGHYTENGTFMPHGSPAVNGRAAIQQAAAGMFEAFSPSGMTLSTDRIEIHGGSVVEIGRYSMNLTPPGQTDPIEDKGKYVAVWKQVDGEWKLHIDIFNGNQHARPAGGSGL